MVKYKYMAGMLKGTSILMAVMLVLTILFCAFKYNLKERSSRDIVQEYKELEKKVVLLNNQEQIIPLKYLDRHKIASVNTGSVHAAVFDSLLGKYALISRYAAGTYRNSSGNLDGLHDDLKFYDTVIIQVTSESLNDTGVQRFISEIKKNKQIILAGFGDAGSLKQLEAITAPIVWSTAYTEAAAGYTAQLLFGGVPAKGKLMQTISPKYTLGTGFTTGKIRLMYSAPEAVGVNTSGLEKIDAIAAEAIREKATPGAVVMVVKDGHVIFNKAYGYHTYDQTRPVRVSDIFDLASVTKISATTMAVMRLYEQQKIRLDTNLGAYISKARQTDKNSITVREVLLHQAGFVPYIPFYTELTPDDYRRDSSYAYPVKVADNYFLRRNYFEEVMWPRMLNSPVQTRGKYVYSDLSMYFMKEIVEQQSGEHINQYVAKEFYDPLGMYTAGFNPRYRFERDRIVPTEQDEIFRKTLLQGYVHDQGAAMANGVAGHAGLFASANDLAILYQMMLNHGTYGGVRYFNPKTIDLFTSRQSDVSRRGLGFDRWDPKKNSNYPSGLASSQTYGHTGYTGTCVWVDPQYNLIYIFLSNRVHPVVTNKLSELNIRPRIQDIIYEAIQKGRR